MEFINRSMEGGTRVPTAQSAMAAGFWMKVRRPDVPGRNAAEWAHVSNWVPTPVRRSAFVGCSCGICAAKKFAATLSG